MMPVDSCAAVPGGWSRAGSVAGAGDPSTGGVGDFEEDAWRSTSPSSGRPPGRPVFDRACRDRHRRRTTLVARMNRGPGAARRVRGGLDLVRQSQVADLWTPLEGGRRCWVAGPRVPGSLRRVEVHRSVMGWQSGGDGRVRALTGRPDRCRLRPRRIAGFAPGGTLEDEPRRGDAKPRVAGHSRHVAVHRSVIGWQSGEESVGHVHPVSNRRERVGPCPDRPAQRGTKWCVP
jgi:hypothetical protein